MQASRSILAYLAAVAVASVLGSIVQTQFNLAALQQLDIDITWSARLLATVHDLRGFAPLYGLVTATALAIALPVAALLRRRWSLAVAPVNAVAGFTAILCALALMNTLLPVTVVAATRSLVGLLAMSLCGAVGGVVFARLSPRSEASLAPH